MATFRDLKGDKAFGDGIDGLQSNPEQMSRRESMAFWLIGSAVIWAVLFAAFIYLF